MIFLNLLSRVKISRKNNIPNWKFVEKEKNEFFWTEIRKTVAGTNCNEEKCT